MSRVDLNDAELDELGLLLEATPAPLDALDVPMLDGFLAGVVVQPQPVPEADWLRWVFDGDEGRALPADVDPAWLARCRSLILRRRDVLQAGLADEGWFDPIVLDTERAPPPSEYEAPLPEHSRALLPWVAGFRLAQERFPALLAETDDEVASALGRLYRHLPAANDEQRDLIAALDREHPIDSTDAAVAALVAAVSDLWELTSAARYHVEPVRRTAPKVGRNDPCPCGSGRKFKQCHGKG
jgi:uncharacterized protein